MVTATQLSSYLYCPRKLFINTILLVEEPPKKELIKGKIWHETYELMNDSEKSIVLGIRRKDYQDITDVYRKRYSKILRDVIIRHKSELKAFDIQMTDIFTEYWSNFDEEAKEHALNLVRFIEAHEVYGEELWEKLTPKILSEQYFKSERLNLSGVVDVLEIHDIAGDKIFVPIELKTGKFPDKGMWDGHKIQLAAYMLLLEDSGKKVDEAVIRYKDADKRILQMNTFLRDEVLELITKTSNLLNNKVLPDFVDNKNKCKNCQVKDECYDKNKMKALLIDAELRLKKGK